MVVVAVAARRGSVEHDVPGNLIDGKVLARAGLGEDALDLLAGEAVVGDCLGGGVVCLGG